MGRVCWNEYIQEVRLLPLVAKFEGFGDLVFDESMLFYFWVVTRGDMIKLLQFGFNYGTWR